MTFWEGQKRKSEAKQGEWSSGNLEINHSGHKGGKEERSAEEWWEKH